MSEIISVCAKDDKWVSIDIASSDEINIEINDGLEILADAYISLNEATQLRDSLTNWLNEQNKGDE
ncbi:MAG: hypothetical protein COA78_22105 [Blastopirellula sp.]|nr:MAG: hypothetical protein COA78_22105 [Blastopirellula sp.]